MLSAEIAGATETTVVNIVYMESLKRNIDPARAEQNVPPNLIDCTTIPAIPQQYQQTKKTNEVLTNPGHWFTSGTFKLSRGVFTNLQIHTEQVGKISCSFTLLPNKSQATYTKFLQELFNIIGGNRPAGILLDFEINTLNAIQNLRPHIKKKGCFYHPCANIRNHI